MGCIMLKWWFKVKMLKSGDLMGFLASVAEISFLGLPEKP